MQDQITRELEQIIANRIGDVGRCEDDCACTYCCAQRALRLRMLELKRQTTIIGEVSNES